MFNRQFLSVVKIYLNKFIFLRSAAGSKFCLREKNTIRFSCFPEHFATSPHFLPDVRARPKNNLKRRSLWYIRAQPIDSLGNKIPMVYTVSTLKIINEIVLFYSARLETCAKY